jgi:Phage integrase family
VAKKRRVNRTWNKGFEMGQKDALTPAQVKRVRHALARRGVPGLRDLALFSVAIDTMLQGPELLNLTVKDVRGSDGRVRQVIEVERFRGKPPVRCALSKVSANALGKWIAVSGKKRADYIFPGRGANSSRSMTARQMSRLLKSWIAEAGLDPKKYGMLSISCKAPAIWRCFECCWATRRSNPQPDIYVSPKSPTRSLFLEPSISDRHKVLGMGCDAIPSTYRPQHLRKQTLQRRDCGGFFVPRH